MVASQHAEPRMLEAPLRSFLGIVLGGQLSDKAGADVFADDAAVRLAAAGVVAAASLAALPAHRVV